MEFAGDLPVEDIGHRRDGQKHDGQRPVLLFQERPQDHRDQQQAEQGDQIWNGKDLPLAKETAHEAILRSGPDKPGLTKDIL